MRLVVMSDSHGNVDYVRVVLGIAKSEEADLIIHLGDDSTDIVGSSASNILSVPGVYESVYADESVKNRILKEFEGLRILASHTRGAHPNDIQGDLKPEELIANKEVDVVLFGHSHLYYAEVENGVLFVNPGHLKIEDKKGMPPTYAVLDMEGRSVSVSIVGIDGKKYLEKKFVL